MAALGCNAMERNDLVDNNATKITLSLKRNGLSNGCYCEEKLDTRNACRNQLFGKLLKINGSAKSNNNNCFPRPSVPSLRTRRERNLSGPESEKRKRKSSRHDSGDARIGDPPENGYHITLETPPTPSTPDSIEVATINESYNVSKNNILCNSSPGCSPVAKAGNITPSKELQSGDITPSKELQTQGPIECQWKDCDKVLENGEIMEHICLCHVQTQKGREKFVCLWKGCKVYNKPSSSKCWLDGHILTHSGDKPFRCIVARCGQRFTSQGGLERHVNSHFNAQDQSPNSKQSKHGREDTPTKLFKRKRLKQKRKAIRVKTEDYFDTGSMEQLQQQLNLMSEATQIDLNGSNNTVTFHSSVIARRKDASGKAQFLLHWTPEDVIPDEWVFESQVPFLHIRSIPIGQLPLDSVVSLHPSLYHQHRHRKHRRK